MTQSEKPKTLKLRIASFSSTSHFYNMTLGHHNTNTAPVPAGYGAGVPGAVATSKPYLSPPFPFVLFENPLHTPVANVFGRSPLSDQTTTTHSSGGGIASKSEFRLNRRRKRQQSEIDEKLTYSFVSYFRSSWN